MTDNEPSEDKESLKEEDSPKDNLELIELQLVSELWKNILHATLVLLMSIVYNLIIYFGGSNRVVSDFNRILQIVLILVSFWFLVDFLKSYKKAKEFYKKNPQLFNKKRDK